MWLKERSKEAEIMDGGLEGCSLEEFQECLGMLGKIGVLLRGNQISLKALKQIFPFKSVLDVGCGGGDFTDIVAKKFKDAKVVGFDIDKNAIDYANQKFKSDNLSFVAGDLLPSEKFDVILATLVCHHFEDDFLVNWIRDVYEKADKAVVLNDLHRHPIAVLAYFLVSYFLFPNRLIRKDGILSIKKGFKRKEWLKLLERAIIPKNHISISWRWPFRWCVILQKHEEVCHYRGWRSWFSRCLSPYRKGRKTSDH